MRGAERVMRGLCTKGEWGRDFIMGDMRAWCHIPLYDKQLYTPQTLYLLPRDEEGLYNSLNYRRLRPLPIRAEYRVQMTEYNISL